MKFFICLFALAASAMSDSGLDLLRSGNEQFTAKMFQEVTAAKAGQSIVISAFSVLSPLAQLALASEGPSHDEILRTIGLPNDEVTKQVFTDVSRDLRSVSGVELKLANRVYVKKDAQLNEEFSTVSRDVFNSDAKNIDFSQSNAAANEINAWVEDNTNHRIKNLVDPQALTSNTEAVLVNAIYFKGDWLKPFEPMDTKDRTFHVSKDKTIKVPTMYKSDNLKYTESKELDAKLLEIPYKGGDSSLLIVLPNEIDGITGLVNKLGDPSALNKAVDEMYYTDVYAYIPKFKIETTTDLGQVLKKLGLTKLFTPGAAQLTKLLKGSPDVYISGAIQKAYIDVNEQGAEAAAANEFGIAYLSAIIQETITFKADHPFVFFLKEKNNILFSGVFQS